ncbi:hypothetical protein [Reichenbachiella sp. MALMAid0571]|uniref:hypothetical protein n=1 Tax=Reichenbachiella sp. MALMAid0571 TaxID=3143939 RepID=UPI0032DFC52E
MKRIISILAVLGCCIACVPKEYRFVEVDNPRHKKNTAFRYSEDLSSPKFQQLKAKYQLDTIFHGNEDEFERILELKQWITNTIPIDNFGDPYPGGGYVESILDEALSGTGFHCGHFMRVQNGVMNAYGYVTRTIGAGPGVAGIIDSHHGISETWVNAYNKWVLLDAKYNHYFEKNGIPLSALEIRDEYLKNKAKDITMIRGLERIPTEFDETFQRSKESFARTYSWIEYHTNNNMFTVWPDYKETLTMYTDDYFKNNTWIWGEKPHWAYGKPEFMILEPNRDAIEWTPNTISSEVSIEGNKANVGLNSDTPNLKGYQMKRLPNGNWQKAESNFSLDLTEDEHEIVFRTINLAGISGPEHLIKIQAE